MELGVVEDPLGSQGNVLIKIARKSRLTRLAAATMFDFKNSVVGSNFKPQNKTYAKGLGGILQMQEGFGQGGVRRSRVSFDTVTSGNLSRIGHHGPVASSFPRWR